MKTTDHIRQCLDSSKEWALGLINDMKDDPLAQPTSAGGNHATWILGHIVRSESDLLDCFILGRPNRFPEYEGLFAMGTTPTANAADYPSIDELLTKFDEIRAASLAHLDTLTDDDLDARSHAAEEFGPHFATVGACYAAMSTHTAFHAGQVAVVRRAVGRAPLMA